MIIAVDNGRIVDIGTHRQLLEEDGFYAKLYNSQYALQKETNWKKAASVERTRLFYLKTMVFLRYAAVFKP